MPGLGNVVITLSVCVTPVDWGIASCGMLEWTDGYALSNRVRTRGFRGLQRLRRRFARLRTGSATHAKAASAIVRTLRAYLEAHPQEQPRADVRVAKVSAQTRGRGRSKVSLVTAAALGGRPRKSVER